ncbi:NADPH-dependent 1-acyldihydroxyacetone phosphate reductase [Paramyrothecium foliicola]|nr:NADPH-dependent 1-acyldihydroxyacetone phosphate reductase [Paramyrothecium foliicola]
MATVQEKTALITGCSTGGIGWAMAKVFQERGYYVFATLRDPAKAKDLAELSNIEILELDVTAVETIVRCKETVAKRTGGKLDVLINNAGVEFVCPLLDTDITEAKKLYDVNVWGPLAMVQAFAPLILEAKGIISNHSSLAAALPMVWTGESESLDLTPSNSIIGIYAGAKAAEARMSEVMRIELEPLGVRVVTVMVGSLDTPIFGKPGGKMDLLKTSYYYGIEDHAQRQRMAHQGESMPVEPFARQLVKEILGKHKGPIWLGTYAAIVRFATWACPKWYVDMSSNSDRGIELVKLPRACHAV